MAKYEDNKKLDYSVLLKELKQDGLEKLYMLWGPEDYLIRDFAERLRTLCLPEGADEFNAKRLDGPVPDPRDLEEAVNAMPFFGDRTFVEVRDADVNRWKDELFSAVLKDIPDWCTVVITLPAGASPDGRLGLVKQIKKDGKAVEFTSQADRLLYPWIRKRFASHGKTIQNDAIDRLTFISGELMNQLIPEIDKICTYTRAEQIGVEDVEKLANHIPEAKVFDMTDAIADGKYDKAMYHLYDLLAGDSEPVEIMGSIGWQMRQLYAARLVIDSGNGAAYLKELLGISNSYRLNKLMDTARKYSSDTLSNDLRLIADYSLLPREKGAVMTDLEALKELLIRFAMEKRHA
ncbi:MAG: DNA polymerase III subunit delta [Oscillospiraceae bacterium]|nr:DNA polymerase III subunit delta [Oscillospiraceae bacterium]